MSVYGLIIKDESGNAVRITPDTINIVKIEQVVMPLTLVDTNKYYSKVDLPDNIDVLVDNVGIIMNAFLLNVNMTLTVEIDGDGNYLSTFFANTFYPQYTKNLSDGVMTAWVPGIMQIGTTDAQWDLITSIYPDVYCDKLSDTEINQVKIFGAMRYHCYDASATAYIDSYMLGDFGVEKVDYAIVLNQKES